MLGGLKVSVGYVVLEVSVIWPSGVSSELKTQCIDLNRSSANNWLCNIPKEIRTDIYALPCVKHIASGQLLFSTGSSAQCSVMT